MTTVNTQISPPTLFDRVMGCWLGKAVGGTLGQTFEGVEGPIAVDGYHPVPTSMVPNDDLDLQVVYAVVMSQMEHPRVDRHVLAASWLEHVRFPWNEYGVALRNLAEGIEAPHTGSFDNWFACGEGAAIRSELWACLAPGDPDLAGHYCYEDACFDHAGDGIHAAVFLARLESLAFVESSPEVLIGRALEAVPADSELRAAILDTQAWVAEGLSWQDVRERIVATHGRDDFTDVRQNTAFMILGWVAGSTFSERICITTGCGADTDSSTASLGALLGILDPAGIEPRWLEPIGTDLVLNRQIVGLEHPATIDGFTRLVLELRERLGGTPPAVEETPFDPEAHVIPVARGWYNTDRFSWSLRDMRGMPPHGSRLPQFEVTTSSLPGTWARIEADDFTDRIAVVRYRMSSHGLAAVCLMFVANTDFRIWLDDDYLFGGEASFFFPAPHSALANQRIQFTAPEGWHDLTVALRRPAASAAEWVIALVDADSKQWIPNAFRPEA